MTQKTYRVGIVGAGWMARAMADDYALVDRAVVHGVVSRTQASADSFASDYGCQVFPSLEAMLADPEIDLINITTPNQLHHPQARAALEAGKPVLLEKPFTLNAAEAADLIRLARTQRLFLMEGMWVRFLPLRARLDELLARNAVGELRLLRGSFHFHPKFDPASRLFNPELGGGALLDLGIYPISFAASIFGVAPESIVSHAHLGASGVDEHFAAILGYPDRGMALVSAGLDGRIKEDVVLYGTLGQIRIPLVHSWRQERLELIPLEGEAQEIEIPVLGCGYVHQVLEVIRCLDEGLLESPGMPLDDSLAIMRILDELRAQWGLDFPGEMKV